MIENYEKEEEKVKFWKTILFICIVVGIIVMMSAVYGAVCNDHEEPEVIIDPHKPKQSSSHIWGSSITLDCKVDHYIINWNTGKVKTFNKNGDEIRYYINPFGFKVCEVQNVN